MTNPTARRILHAFVTSLNPASGGRTAPMGVMRLLGLAVGLLDGHRPPELCPATIDLLARRTASPPRRPLRRASLAAVPCAGVFVAIPVLAVLLAACAVSVPTGDHGDDDEDVDQAGRGRFKAAVEDKLRKPGQSIRGRPGRDRTQLELRVRRQRDLQQQAGQPLDEKAARWAAEAEWDEEKAAAVARHPDRVQSCVAPDLSEDHLLFEEAALFRSPYGQQIRAALAYAMGDRPTDLLVPVAVAMRDLFDSEVPRHSRYIRDFCKVSHPVLEWLFEDPYAKTTGARSRGGVYSILSGRWDKETGECLVPGLWDRTCPRFLDELLVAIWRDIRATGRYPNLGRILGIDGTPAPYALEQRQSVSVEDERSINKKFGLTVKYRKHGDHKPGWRGDLPVTLADLGSQLALASELPDSDQGERDVALELVRRAWEHCPDLGARFLVCDRGFFDEQLAEELLVCYGMVLIVPWKGTIDPERVPYADTFGTPTCSCSGERQLMRYVECHPFYWPDKRAALGLRPGEDIRPKLKELGLPEPRIRWRCERCLSTAATHPHKNALVYCWAPYLECHHPRRADGRFDPRDRHWLRLDALAARNELESLNALIKLKGLWLPGSAACRWVRTRRQAEWLQRGRLLAHNLRRWVHETGAYAELMAEVRARGYDTPGTHRALEQAREAA
jgi:hypothetical protein